MGAFAALAAKITSNEQSGSLLGVFSALALKIISKRLSGGFMGTFSTLASELLQNYFLEISWEHFPRWPQNCFKMASWRFPGSIFRAGL